MAKKTHINVEVSVADIRSSLRKRITSEHADLITDVIMGNLEKTEVGYRQVYLALSGVQEKLRFSPGDKVVVPVDHLSTWKFDKVKSSEAGLIHQGKVKAIVVGADPYVSYPYTVETMMKDSTGIEVKVVSSVYSTVVEAEDEWPDPESDLPF